MNQPLRAAQEHKEAQEVIFMMDSGALNDQGNTALLSDQPQFLTVQQASKLLRVSTWAVYEVIRAGELPVIRWGRRVVLQREDLAVFIASKRNEGFRRPVRFPRRRDGSGTQRSMHAADSATIKPRTTVALGGSAPA